MNQTDNIISIVTQSAQLVASVSTLLGFPMGEKAAAIAPILTDLTRLIDETRAALSGADRAKLDEQLQVIEADIIGLSDTLQAELAKAKG